jgi:hypothetical protein
MLDAKHGGSVSVDPEEGSGIPTVEVRGIIARGSNGELCFFANADADGVPLLDGIDAVIAAVLEAPAREVSREAIDALDRDYS